MIDHIDEKRRFAALMTALSDYYRQEISKGVLGLYWEGLRQYDYEAVEKAAWAHTQNPDEAGRWMPKIADIARMMQGRTDDQAALAWSKVDRAVRHVGALHDVAFDDALIHRVLTDMGGWALMDAKTEDEWPFVAKEFQNRYRGYRSRGETPEYPRIMNGRGNAQNVGKQKQPARLLGDEAKALAVILGGAKALPMGLSLAGAAIIPPTKALT